MSLTAVSLFAGVGGFDLAMRRNGIDVRAAVEIDPKARAILARHFPETALFNDVTEVTGDDLRSAGFVPDRGIITGGFPCQDLSVAGRRAGLAGARSGLFWHIARLMDELAPRWVVLENVPGLLSSHGGRDMGTVVGALGDLGYGWAYRVLDAQHFGVPQRRRRVFIVAGRRAGAADCAGPVQVLLEPEGVSGHPAPRQQAGQGVANAVTGRLGSGGPDDNTAQGNHLVPVAVEMKSGESSDIAPSLRSRNSVTSNQSTGSHVAVLTDSLSRLASVSDMQDVASTVTTGTGQRMDPETESLVVTSWER